MHGLHLTADLHDCRCADQWLIDAGSLKSVCHKAAIAAGLQPVGELTHSFPSRGHGPGGVTAAVLLAESHLCLHTWPELRAVTLDVYVCNVDGNRSGAAHSLLEGLISLFQPGRRELHSLVRGALRAEELPVPALAGAAS
ncbi:S-adenosylmethionine decarboxylase [Variovorax dokdonensis]|uniref:S-adenosylmethionine decarboxylase n=1 Tax=Variovorax dokdonensis TaxID=344883 RepID=A0ABT7N9G6_9BURK|nr:S-adenosylmethionine decarboxylase [Variovorax dokdonensis]MDM0044584.1 S-adenosylmethionine decarboxylase [Variovorax dokdonensis]